jgi:hypothetical protein
MLKNIARRWKVSRQKSPSSEVLIRSTLLLRLAYLSPLIGFLWALPAMQHLATFIDWQIYIFSLLLVIIFALNAGTRPIVRIEEVHLTFYHATTGKIAFCYLDDIRYVEVKRHGIIVYTKDGNPLVSPYLSKNDIKKTLYALERHNLFISYKNN